MEEKPNFKTTEGRKLFINRAIYAAARLFLEKGYTGSSTREIAELAGINVTSMNRHFGTKENLLCELVEYVLNGQFQATEELLAGVTEDKMLLYAAETTMQLYMAESGEHIRDLYEAAYSMPKSAEIIRRMITGKLADIFGELHPKLNADGFYKLEIATGGIMRSFMLIPCHEGYMIDEKAADFLTATFRVLCVPEKKIQEAIGFVSKFDFERIAQETIAGMMKKLESMEELLQVQ